MANASNLLLLTALLALTTPFMASSFRPLNNRITSRSNLAARLKLDGKSSNCWDSLIHLKACSSEVIVFFINGQTYLGQGCCLAIRTIEHQCWPALLGSLGFFPEETDILRGYCYANQLETSPTLPRPFDESTGKFVPDLEKYIP
ncbi:PREDICTED: egg cell-secreted protein 1.1-like [Fragaria vesca subsp. vesca]|uniref:egg cell-secreted protein 1.1-like n=1 Tax=Fragaria vesca subsp. vesca TaxID=101020 RepID=UPI0002C35387|nr:PREDICTED: egg cell-secreted protein 1.1-like [Fragaria vesca subsp. vesca]